MLFVHSFARSKSTRARSLDPAPGFKKDLVGHTSAVHEAMTFKTSFIFQLQWNLLILAFWHRQKTGFEASERNIDA